MKSILAIGLSYNIIHRWLLINYKIDNNFNNMALFLSLPFSDNIMKSLKINIILVTAKDMKNKDY